MKTFKEEILVSVLKTVYLITESETILEVIRMTFEDLGETLPERKATK